MSGSLSPKARVTVESQIDDEIFKYIMKAIHQINYGSVEIVIHDSKIVQIERKEKIRFDSNIARERS